jgi:hypothetical protein
MAWDLGEEDQLDNAVVLERKTTQNLRVAIRVFAVKLDK